MKKKFSFRLGCTSYVYPDDILPNAEKTAPLVDDIEIILYEWSGENNLPDTYTIKNLLKIAEENQLTYTIHLPINIKAGSNDSSEREEFIKAAENIINITADLNPHAFIMHFEGISAGAEKPEIDNWKGNITSVCKQIIKYTDPEKIAVENLNYPPEWHVDIIDKFSFSLCLDIGHVWLYGQDIDFYINNFSKVKVIHIHGVNNGKDHISLGRTDKRKLKDFFDIFMKKYKNVLTMEVFNLNDFNESRNIIINHYT